MERRSRISATGSAGCAGKSDLDISARGSKLIVYERPEIQAESAATQGHRPAPGRAPDSAWISGRS